MDAWKLNLYRQVQIKAAWVELLQKVLQYWSLGKAESTDQSWDEV